jgi:hypothetical protein
MDDLNTALANAKTIAGGNNPLDSDITTATNNLINTIIAVQSAIADSLTASTSNVQTDNNLNQTISFNINGVGQFNSNIATYNIALGGDFTGLTIQSVTIPTGKPTEADVILTGALSVNTGTGTITFGANSYTRPGTATPLSDSFIITSSITTGSGISGGNTTTGSSISGGNTTTGSSISAATSTLNSLVAQANTLTSTVTAGTNTGNCSTGAYNNLQSSIIDSQSLLGSGSALLNDLTSYTDMLQNSINTVNATIIPSTTGSSIQNDAALSALNNEITTSQAFTAVVEGTSSGQSISVSAITAFNIIFNNAEIIASNPYSKDSDYTNACTDLQQALSTLQMSMQSTTGSAISVATSTLNSLIAQATTLTSSVTSGANTGNCSTEAYNNLQSSIIDSQNLLGSGSILLNDLTSYADMLQNSMNTVNATIIPSTTGSSIQNDAALTALNNEITTSQAFTAVVQGTSSGQSNSLSAITAFQIIFNNAKIIASNSYSKDSDYTNACTNLQQALSTLQASIQ